MYLASIILGRRTKKKKRFYLHGYSGGGQFAHRFLYLHPARLRGVSIGAPGSITHPTRARSWPGGIGDAEKMFGSEPDFALIAEVPVQILVGEKDTETGMLSRDDVAGATRVERAKYLHSKLVERGVSATLSIVPDVAHDGNKCLPTVESWLSGLLL